MDLRCRYLQVWIVSTFVFPGTIEHEDAKARIYGPRCNVASVRANIIQRITAFS